jgi:hypothetical protein
MRPLRPIFELLCLALVLGLVSCNNNPDDGFGGGQDDDDDDVADDDDDATGDDDVADDDDDDDVADDDDDVADDDDDDDVADDDDAMNDAAITGQIGLGKVTPASAPPWTVVVSVYNDGDFELGIGPTAEPAASITLVVTKFPEVYQVNVPEGFTYGVAAYLDDNGSGTDGPDPGDLLGLYPDYVESPAPDVNIFLDMLLQ